MNAEESPEDGKDESPLAAEGLSKAWPEEIPEMESTRTTYNLQPATQMEVHHHPKVEKKNFKEYLLEGLMIFLAVTIGFFAESLRENINDKEKEREYISSLISNLQQDTLSLRSTISDNQTKMKGLDSLIDLAAKNLIEPADRKLLYEYSGRYASFYSAFSSNDATMMQLKYSGALRLIRHSHVADSIAKYDQEMRGIYAAEAPYSKSINDAMESTQELLIYTVRRDTTYFKKGAFTGKALPLLTNDIQKIKIFFNRISIERGWTQNYIVNMQERLPFTIRLIDFLKNEYEIE